MGFLNIFGRTPRLTDFRGRTAVIFSSNSHFLEYYQGIIVSLGMTPLTALNVESALAIFRMTPVALVLVDQSQGSSACRQALQSVRQRQKHAVVVVISPSANPFSRLEAKELGVAGCLDHPAMRDDIAHALVPNYRPA